MAITAIAEFHAKPGAEERLRGTLAAMIEPTLAEEGCLEFQSFVDPDDPGHMIMLERWESDAALDAHRPQPHTRHAMQVFAEILKAPPTVRKLIESV